MTDPGRQAKKGPMFALRLAGRRLAFASWIILLTACGAAERESGDAAEKTAESVEKAVKAEADEEAEAIADEVEGKRKKKDRGDASAKIGDAIWEASSAKARIRNGTLTIQASRNDMSGPSVKRQELHLQIDNYAGPGDYRTGRTGSRFVGVGINKEEAKQAVEKDEESGKGTETTKVATKAITGASHTMLAGVEVHIETADDAQITGTFSWQPPKGLKDPPIRDGQFRALIRKPK